MHAIALWLFVHIAWHRPAPPAVHYGTLFDTGSCGLVDGWFLAHLQISSYTLATASLYIATILQLYFSLAILKNKVCSYVS